MDLRNLLIILLISLGVHHATAFSCRETPEKTLTAEFKIVAVENAHSKCIYNENGKILEGNTALVPQSGCVLSLEVIKIKSGEIEAKEKSALFVIYNDGPLCYKKSGDPLNAKIKSITNECCGQFGKMREGKFEYCKMTPTPSPIQKMPLKMLMCAQKDVNWEIAK